MVFPPQSNQQQRLRGILGLDHAVLLVGYGQECQLVLRVFCFSVAARHVFEGWKNGFQRPLHGSPSSFKHGP